MAVALGAMLIAASMLADWLPGAASSALGWKQVLACMTGIALLAAGLLPKTRWRGSATAVRWLIAIWLAVTSFALSRVAPVLAASWASWVLLGYAAAICALIPLRVGILVFIGLLVLHLTLTAVSRVKIDLTGMPLTMLDVRIALDNPQGLSDAAFSSNWTLDALYLLLIVALLCLLVVGFQALRDIIAQRHDRKRLLDVACRALAACAVFLLVSVYLDVLYAAMARDRSSVGSRSRRTPLQVGRCTAVSCIFTSHQVRGRTGDFFRSDLTGSPPAADEIRNSVLRQVGFSPGSPQSANRPNIVVVLAESTFDPDRAFRLQGTWNDGLFLPGPRTAAVGPLRVNPVGGGTWITEFETITGLDSRLFGYAGWYTHASLSPFVERSFASHLRKRGYRTSAFFPHRADFYNARRAYARYGFESMADSDDLGSDVQINDDVEMAERVVKSLGASPAAPRLAYVLFIGNHFPHECNADSGGFTARFLDSDDFTVNCELNVYLQRLDSTTFARRRRVRGIPRGHRDAYGAPLCPAGLWGHQPASFTGSRSAVVRDYRPYRRSPDLHMTFFRIQTSMPGRLTCCEPAPPATVLPTLLSAFVADRPEDIYLGENLWLYERCGLDAIGNEYVNSLNSMQPATDNHRSPECTRAYEQAIAAFRSSNIIRIAEE